MRTEASARLEPTKTSESPPATSEGETEITDGVWAESMSTGRETMAVPSMVRENGATNVDGVTGDVMTHVNVVVVRSTDEQSSKPDASLMVMILPVVERPNPSPTRTTFALPKVPT